MFVFSLALFAASVGALATYGLNFGVDFKGGSVWELEFKNERPDLEKMRSFFSDIPELKGKEVAVSESGDKGVLVRTEELAEATHQDILKKLQPALGTVEEKRFDSVGPAVGAELRRKSIIAIVILLTAILIYIAFIFRALSKTLSLWAMVGATIVGLLHDIVIPMGIFAWLGHAHGVQVSAVFVAAILTILGYTVSDKVVIFDRVRENIIRGAREGLPEVVHKSVMQTLVRSINNTLTVILSSLAIYLYGGESIRYFALALILGIALGAYSSIFVAAPLLVWWSKKRHNS